MWNNLIFGNVSQQNVVNDCHLQIFLKNLQKNHPSLHIFTGQIDARLDKNKFIVPGLRDAGDRYMGT